MTHLRVALAAALALCAACGSGRIASGTLRAGSSAGGQTNPVCAAGAHPGRAQAPVFVRNAPLYAFDAGGARLWRYDYTHGKPVMYASEPAIADLDQDGSPEVVSGLRTGAPSEEPFRSP